MKIDVRNIPDPRYVQWIEQNHPEDGLIDLFPNAAPLEPLSLEWSDVCIVTY